MSKSVTLPYEELKVLLDAADYASLKLCDLYKQPGTSEVLKSVYFDKIERLAEVQRHATETLGG